MEKMKNLIDLPGVEVDSEKLIDNLPEVSTRLDKLAKNAIIKFANADPREIEDRAEEYDDVCWGDGIIINKERLAVYLQAPLSNKKDYETIKQFLIGFINYGAYSEATATNDPAELGYSEDDLNATINDLIKPSFDKVAIKVNDKNYFTSAEQDEFVKLTRRHERVLDKLANEIVKYEKDQRRSSFMYSAIQQYIDDHNRKIVQNPVQEIFDEKQEPSLGNFLIDLDGELGYRRNLIIRPFVIYTINQNDPELTAIKDNNFDNVIYRFLDLDYMEDRIHKNEFAKLTGQDISDLNSLLENLDYSDFNVKSDMLPFSN